MAEHERLQAEIRRHLDQGRMGAFADLLYEPALDGPAVLLHPDPDREPKPRQRVRGKELIYIGIHDCEFCKASGRVNPRGAFYRISRSSPVEAGVEFCKRCGWGRHGNGRAYYRIATARYGEMLPRKRKQRSRVSR